MDPFEAIKITFFQECEEQLAELEAGLLAMQEGSQDPEVVNAIFRAVHSIKGGAGTFSLEALVRFAHVFETALEEMRSNRLAPEPHVVALMLRASDVLADHVRAARDGGSVDEQHSRALAEELGNLCGVDANAGADPVDSIEGLDFVPVQFSFGGAGDGDAAPFDLAALLGPLPQETAVQETALQDAMAQEAMAKDAASEALSAVAGKRWTIVFTPRAGLYASGNETALLVRELGRLGAVEVTLDASRLPMLPQLDPEQSYLTFTVKLISERGEGDIRDVFEFVDTECDLRIVAGDEPPPTSGLDIHALLELAQGAVPGASSAPIAPSHPASAGEASDLAALMMMIEDAKVAVAVDEERMGRVAGSAAATVNSAASPAASPARNPAPAPAAPASPAADQPAAAGGNAAAANAAGQTIRVDLERVDRLIDLVGELVINQAMLAQRVAESGLARSSSVAIGLDDLEHLTREIQDSVMAIRAQPVKSVFQRMPRLVREVAAMVGKQVRLVTEGEGTEVDKTVIERLADPITHMIRNAIDHGLEETQERIAAGKSAEGVVRLAALHRSGRIVIEVSDDGRGINRERVKQSAIGKGLIAHDSQLTDEEIDNLIFMPGFSTAATISDISGRGVGMDVVKRSIQALGGRISIVSEPGRGSTFTMSLPLTLAVLDGMVVSVCGQTLVAPLTGVVETLQPKAADVRSLGANGTVISIRDSYLPLIDVGVKLGYRDTPLLPTAGVALLVEGEGGQRAALLVDAIQGQQQVVIKSLEANYRQVAGIAAATILGDGRVALILDIDAAMTLRMPEGPRAAAPPSTPIIVAAAG